MKNRILRRAISLVLCLVMVLGVMPVLEIPVFAASVSDIPTEVGLSITYGNSGSGTVKSTSPLNVTLTIAGTGSCSGGSTQTSDIVITNTSGVAQTVTFTYDGTIANNGEFWEDGVQKMGVNESSKTTKSIASNNVSLNMKAGDTKTFKIVSGKGTSSVVTLNLKNITTAPIATSEITFLTSEGGSYTVDGSAVTEETKISKIEVPVVATADSGYSFLGWVEESTGRVFSLKASDTITFSESVCVKPLFVENNSATAWYLAAGNHLVADLNEAINIVKRGAGSSFIILKTSGILPAGNYEIPAGVSMLLPYSSAEIFRAEPQEWSLEDMSLNASNFPDPPEVSIVSGKTYSSVGTTEYIRLTMAEGAHITLNGTLEVSGQTHPLASGTWGNYAVLQMSSNTSITVGSTGKLFAWGYVRGNGTITVEPSGTVFEHYDVADYPAGGAGDLDPMNEAGVFGLTNYAFNNVEVPTTYKAGAKLKAYMVMTGFNIGTNAFLREFIGNSSDSVFRLNSGIVTKSYVGGRQKLEFTDNAEVALNKLYININATIVNYTIDSSKTSGMPLSHNWDIIMKGNSTATLNCSLLMYAGSTLTVENGSKIVVPSGVKLSLLDPTSDPSGVTSDAVLDLNGEIETSGGFYTSTTNGDLPVVKSSKGTGKVTVKVVGTEETINVRSDRTTAAVNVVPAKLQNNNGTYVNSDSVNTFTNTNGNWQCATHTDVNHNCSVCGATEISTCADNDADHNCDICGKVLTECADSDDEDLSCDLCGKNLCEHPTKEAIAGKDPTCTETGLTAGEKCTVCGSFTIEQTEIAELGHTGGTATCTEKAVCTRCEKEYGDVLAHTEVIDAALAATCTDTGLTEGKHCSACNTVLVAQEVVPAKGHNYNAVVTAPTCTAGGYTTYTCACGDSYIADEVAATGHNYEAVVTAPTCTAGGYTTYTCACGDSYIADEVAATDHNYEAVVTAPTCTAGGYTTYTCTVCGNSYVADEVAATGHTYNSVQTPPTCTAGGYTTYTCACGDTYVGDEVSATGHDYQETATTNPSCTEAGSTLYTCGSCGDTYTEDIEATGHTYEAIVTPPTCTAGGYTTHVCSCGDNYTDSETAATGHNPGEAVKENEAYNNLHNATSHDMVTYCTECSTELHRETVTTQLKQEEFTDESIPEAVKEALPEITTVEALEEHMTESVQTFFEAALEGTELDGAELVDVVLYKNDNEAGTDAFPEDGKMTVVLPVPEGTNIYQYSFYVGHMFTSNAFGKVPGEMEYPEVRTFQGEDSNEYIEFEVTGLSPIIVGYSMTDPCALGHEVEVIPGYDATCTESGLTDGEVCTVCGTTITAQEEIPALEHNYSIIVEEPSCTMEGCTHYVCMECDYSYTTDHVGALGHNYSTVVTPPTCTEGGYTEYTCDVCGDPYTADYTEATGHSYGEGVVTDPNCTTAGYTTYTCGECGDSYFDSVVDALGHTEGTVVVENKIDVTCTAAGSYDNVVYCTVCTAEISRENVTVASTGHVAGDVSTVVDHLDPDCDDDGYTVYVFECTVCHTELNRETITIGAVGHDLIYVEGNPATCTEAGYEAYEYCDVTGCDYTTYA